MTTTLTLPRDVREELLEHARAGDPEEVVGVLGGERTASTATVRRRLPAENAAATPETRYEIDPAETIRLIDRLTEDGFEVVGFYHSHPRGPPEPSATDVRLAAWPGHSSVVVSLGGPTPTVGSWRWNGEAFERERIRIDP